MHGKTYGHVVTMGLFRDLDLKIITWQGSLEFRHITPPKYGNMLPSGFDILQGR
jgi:hypothetical protein